MMDINAAGQTVKDFQELLNRTPPEAEHIRISPDAWTLTEIVGHLVDSACNNHQRFVRLGLGDLENFPGYQAEQWVQTQNYDACDFGALALLWASYNALLLHVAASVPRQALGNVWIDTESEYTLEYLIEDYYVHLQLHTGHYAERLEQVLAQVHGERKVC
ncbi:MAG: hypothetical protein ACNI3A_18460 [Desulfovibrio sp.]|uniref:hypothetical protein n=1 Tax=Desulfovibrio sp. 7SRBS1 TaxID=3378064 RepID=UPI003B40AAA5